MNRDDLLLSLVPHVRDRWCALVGEVGLAWFEWGSQWCFAILRLKEDTFLTVTNLRFMGVMPFSDTNKLWRFYSGMSRGNHCSLQPCKFLPYRTSPLAAQRIGEASNPGPFEARFLVTNPTAILHKAETLASLQADVCLLAETSATKLVQISETKAFRNLGYRSLWGMPVPTQLVQHRECDGYRGMATGVSCHSKFPGQLTRHEPTDTWEVAGRFVHCFLKLGQLEIQVAVIYGFPSCQAQSRARTNCLLQYAVDRLRRNHLPFIIAGDFNHHPSTLETYEMLQHGGCATVEDWYTRRHGIPLPATFTNTTRNDVAILSPEIFGMLSDVTVNQDHLIAGHNPLLFTLTCSGQSPTRTVWPLPHSWLQLEPSSTDIDQFFNWDSNCLETGQELLQWSRAVEAAVDEALLHSSTDAVKRKGLPSNFRGRCEDIQPKTMPLTRLITPGRHDDFHPDVDQPTVLIRNLTAQVRRIASLTRRVSCGKHQAMHELQTEWNCVLKAKGCKSHFWDWLLAMPELYPVPLTVPSHSFLHDLRQLLEHHVKSLVYDHNKRRTQLATFMRERDVKCYGKKQAYQSVREASPGLMDQLQFEIQTPVQVIEPLQHGLITVAFPPDASFDPAFSCTLNGATADTVSYDSHRLELMLHDADVDMQLPVVLAQMVHMMEPQQVATRLNDYWLRFWDQDRDVTNSHWDEFLNMLDSFPPQQPIPNTTATLEDWCWAVSHLKKTTARGICGWGAGELQALPRSCIQALKEAFDHLMPQGLPAYMMRARVIALSKKPGCFEPGAVRPITILSLLYRLWSKTATRGIFRCWGDLFPPEVTGFLPRRSPTNMLYALQTQLEQAIGRNHVIELGGLTLDLQKAFNNIPRVPCRDLLLRLGVDPMLVHCWFVSLERMTRSWQIQGQLYEMPLTTCGVPEGDQWSVLCMLSINRLLVHVLKQNHATVSSHLFADNWSFHSGVPEDHQPLVEQLQQFTSLLHIPIDWNKTFCWATSQGHRHAWQTVRNNLDFAHDLCQVSNARDLGIIMHFRCRMTRGTQSERHQQALQRLTKLQHQQFDYKTKAEIIQSAVLPKALFGTHAYAVGATFFEELRTGIKYALLGEKKNAQPYLTLMLLTQNLQDPEQYAIIQALLHARDYVHHVDEDTEQSFYSLVATTNRAPHTIMGPAGALQFYLAKIDWQLTRQGNLLIAAFFQLHLKHANWQDIVDAVQQSWLEHVAVQVSSRKGCRHMPVIDRRSTVSVFESLEASEKHAVALQLCGAPMTGEQKSKFSDGTETCIFCSEPDTKEHQLLHCSATESMRLQHRDVCDKLEEHGNIHILQPAVFQHEHFEHIRTVQFALPEADLQIPPLGPGIFTDGSCQLPHSVNHRWAAYSVVCPMSTLEDIVADVHLPLEHILNRHFTVAGVALLSGQQTIPRAELAAVVQSHEAQLLHQHEATVFTDSAYVLKCYAMLQTTRRAASFHRVKNFDLLTRWHTLLWTQQRRTPTEKVKAHQTLMADTHYDTWLRIGNAIADLVAKKAAMNLMPSYVQQLQQMNHDELELQQFFQQQLHLRQDLAVMRKQLAQQPDQVEQYNPQATLLQYQNWHVDTCIIFPFHEEEDHWIFHLSRWGTRFTHVLVQWLGTLRFSAQSNEEDCGITWLELLFNFWMQTQFMIPLRIRGFYRQIAEVPEWSIEQFTVNDCIVSFSGAIKHVEFLLQREMIPTKRGQQISSLYRLGGGCHKLGLTQRPQMPLQAESMNWVMTFLKENHKSGRTHFDTMPNIPERTARILTTLAEPLGDTPAAREARYVEWRRTRRRLLET